MTICAKKRKRIRLHGDQRSQRNNNEQKSLLPLLHFTAIESYPPKVGRDSARTRVDENNIINLYMAEQLIFTQLQNSSVAVNGTRRDDEVEEDEDEEVSDTRITTNKTRRKRRY